MRVAIASDHAGFLLKESLKQYLEEKGVKVKDFGTHSRESCHYPEFARRLAGSVSSGRYPKGILICNSGIGNSIVANRFKGVRAALVYNLRAARLSREHNDSNVLVLGAGFLNQSMAKKILNIWLRTKFSGGRHRVRLNLIAKIDKDL